MLVACDVTFMEIDYFINPIFFLFMYLMFEGTFVIGEYPVMGYYFSRILETSQHLQTAHAVISHLV